jgi:capsid protein
MSFIDRAISSISPRWSAERAAWRKIEASVQGGVPTRSSEPWPKTSTVMFGTTADRLKMSSARDRAYNAYENNPVAQTLIDTEVEHVIGDGLNYQPTTDSEDWNKEAEDKYYEWLTTASVRGGDVASGCEIESELYRLGRVAGDAMWLLVKRGTPDRIESRIQIITSEMIVTPDTMYGDPNVFDGIRYDDYGAPVEFYVLNESERDATRRFVPQPARDCVFFPNLLKPDHSRGTTAFRTIFDLLAHLDRYVDGVSLAAWMATVIGIIFKSANPSKQMQALPLLNNAAGTQQRAITMDKGGMFRYVGTDEDVAQVQATQPMQQTPEFVRTMLRMLGQPFGMPLEVIAKDMSTCNFASARIGLLPFYRLCRKRATRFGYRWSRTIKWWLSREALRADGDPKKWTTPFPADYWKHELLANAFDYTDPVSEAQADLLQIDMGTKSPQMVIAERGRDSAKILRELMEWGEKRGDLPEVHSTMTRDPAPDPAEAPPTTQQDNQNANSNGNGNPAGRGGY